MPVELATVAVFRRATVVRRPLTMFNVPLVPVILPTRLSCGWPLTLMVLNFGALEAVPKLRVPARISRFHGTVMVADAALSMSVQLALLEVIERVLVPVGS